MLFIVALTLPGSVFLRCALLQKGAKRALLKLVGTFQRLPCGIHVSITILLLCFNLNRETQDADHGPYSSYSSDFPPFFVRGFGKA